MGSILPSSGAPMAERVENTMVPMETSLRRTLDGLREPTDPVERFRVRSELESLLGEGAAFEGDKGDPLSDPLRELLEEAAALGVPAAASYLGQRLRADGRSEEAFGWFRHAAAEGYVPAMVQVGLMYSNGDGVGKDLRRAADWLRPANVKGSAVGKYLLAECFLFGKGVERNPEIAVTLLREAIEMQPMGRALDLLGACYLRGWGVEREPLRAVELYTRACQAGFYNACANLAVLYMKGEGVPANPSLALDLLREGIEQGENALCMYFMGLAHEEGLGTRRSRRRAVDWMRRAAAAGNLQAREWCASRDISVIDNPPGPR